MSPPEVCLCEPSQPQKEKEESSDDMQDSMVRNNESPKIVMINQNGLS